jgi:hypothetical protein
MQSTSTARMGLREFHLSGQATSAPSYLWYVYRISEYKRYFDFFQVEFFYNDFEGLFNKVDLYDEILVADSLAAGGEDYLTITSLSARQAFAGVQLCGTSEKPYLFLKEISSDGNIQTVDVLFPSMPIFLYSNPILLKYLLDPLFENQEAGLFPQTYAMHDLGANYPRAIGHPTGDGGEFSEGPKIRLVLTHLRIYAS